MTLRTANRSLPRAWVLVGVTSGAMILGGCGRVSDSKQRRRAEDDAGLGSQVMSDDGKVGDSSEKENSRDERELSDGPIVGSGHPEDTMMCRREVTLEGVVLNAPPPFDVVIVADNSQSLSWSQQDLARGLGDLLDNIQGHSARVFVLSSTQYGAGSSEAVDYWDGQPLVRWRDPLTEEPYTAKSLDT